MPHVGSAARALVVAAVVLPAVLFTTAAADPVNVVKLTVLVLCAVALLALGSARLLITRELALPWSANAGAAALLLVAFAIAAVTSAVTASSVLGSYGRNSGVLAYAAAVVVFFALLCTFDRGTTRIVLFSLMGAGGFTAAYGLLQFFGLDAIEWSNPNPVIASLGNSNFAAGYLAICSPAFLWGALGAAPAQWRLLSGAAAAVSLVVALLTDAVQGPLAAAAGVGVLGATWLLDRPARVRLGGLATLGVAGVVGVALLLWGALGSGPAARAFADTGSRARGWFWQTAASAWLDNPVLGVGLERFAPYWLQERPLGAVRSLGGEDVTDAAHSVPLHLLATGGLVLFLAYVTFLGLTAWALVTGLRRLRNEDRLLLGALGGSWAAYQVQSFVSIDQVPLLVAHYALAGAIVVAAGRAHVRSFRLGRDSGAPKTRAARRRTAGPRRLTATDRVLVAVVVALALGTAWMALLPLRADIAARAGDVALRRGEGTPALVAYGRATELLPAEPRYWERLGRLLTTAKKPDEALAAYRRGMDADPAYVPLVRGAARAAEQAGELRAAEGYHRRALELHPNSPRTVIAAAEFALQQGDVDTAKDLVDDALQALPEEASLWVARGQLLAAAGDVEGAREALQRALALDDQAPGAAEGLRSLDADAS